MGAAAPRAAVGLDRKPLDSSGYWAASDSAAVAHSSFGAKTNLRARLNLIFCKG